MKLYPIKNFEKYLIDKNGDIYSTKYKNYSYKKLKKQLTNVGYHRVSLCENNKITRKSVHRLVAQQFIPNPYNKPCVNHINGIKTDNRLENLEWCTYSENKLHDYNYRNVQIWSKGKFGKLHNTSKKVNQLDLQDNFIKKWDCMMDVQRELNIKSNNISTCCNKKQKTAGGFKWEFV